MNDSSWSLERLRSIDMAQFRTLCLSIFEGKGYSSKPVDPPGSSPFGFNLSKKDAKGALMVGLRCFGQNERADMGLMKEIEAAMEGFGYDGAILASASDFSPEIIIFAEDKPIALLNGAEIVSRIEKLDSAGPLDGGMTPALPAAVSPPQAPGLAPQENQAAENAAAPQPDPEQAGVVARLVGGSVGGGVTGAQSSNPSGPGTPEPKLENKPAAAPVSDSPVPAQRSAAEASDAAGTVARLVGGSVGGGTTTSKSPPPVQDSAAKSPPNVEPAKPAHSAAPPSQAPAEPPNKQEPVAAERPVLTKPVDPAAPPSQAPAEPPNVSPAKPVDPAAAASPAGESFVGKLAPLGTNSESVETSPEEGEAPDKAKEKNAVSEDTAKKKKKKSLFTEKGASFLTKEAATPEGTADAEAVSAQEETSEEAEAAGSDEAGTEAAAPSSGPPPIPESALQDQEVDPEDEDATSSSNPAALVARIKKLPPKVAVPAAAGIVLLLGLGGFFLKGSGGKQHDGPNSGIKSGNQAQSGGSPEKFDAATRKKIVELDRRITDLKYLILKANTRRLAIELITLFQKAKASGIDFVQKGGGSMESIVSAMEQGAVVSDPESGLEGERFAHRRLNTWERKRVSRLLQVKDETLQLNPNPASDPEPEYDESPEGSPEEMVKELEEILHAQSTAIARANAEKLAEITSDAKKAKIDFVMRGNNSLSATISEIVAGAVAKRFKPSGEDAFFGMTDLSEKDQKAASAFLKIVGNDLVLLDEPMFNPAPALQMTSKEPQLALQWGLGMVDTAIERTQAMLEDLGDTMSQMVAAQDRSGMASLPSEPVEIRFSEDELSLVLPPEFRYEYENGQELLITPRGFSADPTPWVRVSLDRRLEDVKPTEKEATKMVEALARSLGRPIATAGDKVYYWRMEEFHDGETLYLLTRRIVGFGNSLVHVVEGTPLKVRKPFGQEMITESLPIIIGSLTELRPAPRAAKNQEPAPKTSDPEDLNLSPRGYRHTP